MSDDTLIGLYFHEEPLNWQGKVLGQVEGGLFLCQLFSWVTGDPIEKAAVGPERIESFRFFADPEDWRNYGDRRLQAEQRKREEPTFLPPGWEVEE